MIVHHARAATDSSFELGEGIVWDDRDDVVRWVDINRGRVHSGIVDGDRLIGIAHVTLGQTTGAIALADDGGMLVAAARGLATVSPSGDVSFGPDLLGARREVRLNDGSVDPEGRFVVGTMALGEATGEEVLLRVSADGTTETLRSGIQLSNGIGFSPDGRTIYHVDTIAGTVARHSYGHGPFDHDEPWVTVLDGFPHSPDGLTVDADGMLWVAQWGGSSVRRHAPTGELLAVVEVDATQVTSAGFVGSGSATLAITTAQEGLEHWTDRSGAIFLADVNASGLPEPRWPGSTVDPSW